VYGVTRLRELQDGDLFSAGRVHDFRRSAEVYCVWPIAMPSGAQGRDQVLTLDSYCESGLSPHRWNFLQNGWLCD
jgi:hypothetical protein